MGISNTGTDTESRFREFTGATKTERASDGDAVLEGNLVEIKKASSATLNQVRATKYITLVAHDTRTDDWYVVPAFEVVRLVSRKRRGQHTENPFESATLSINNLGSFRIRNPKDLRAAVLRAVKDSESYPELKREMSQVLAESKALAESSLERVWSTLLDSGIESR
jgi:hypothetical protein